MDDTDRERLEKRVRELCDQGDPSGAAAQVVQGYGPELVGFLIALHRSATEAHETFSEVAEGIWRGMSAFAWESSARTWAYAIARNVARHRMRTAGRHGRRVVNATDSFFQGVVHKVRTETTPFLRTESKSRLEALRDALPDEDRTLLVLRVDRGLAWSELARIVAQEEHAPPLDDAAVVREAARLRKRFQLVKDRLRELARREGLTE